jgi:hypothetical protein
MNLAVSSPIVFEENLKKRDQQGTEQRLIEARVGKRE